MVIIQCTAMTERHLFNSADQGRPGLQGSRLLAVAATEMEMRWFEPRDPAGRWDRLVTGLGPVETALQVCRTLAVLKRPPELILHFGVAGAYCQPGRAGLLDICLAREEILGDFGICGDQKVEDLSGPGLVAPKRFSLDAALLARAGDLLREWGIRYHLGTFITVSCASATRSRGDNLAARYGGLCENMEGAAVARVCQEFGLPCLEIRCISNMVADRDPAAWRLREACQRAGEVAAKLGSQLSGEVLE